jgi:hypothetical protein
MAGLTFGEMRVQTKDAAERLRRLEKPDPTADFAEVICNATIQIAQELNEIKHILGELAARP